MAHVAVREDPPFSDGNGRIGRLLIVLQLVPTACCNEPMWYPSLYFKRHRAHVYEAADEVRLRGRLGPLAGVLAEAIGGQRTAGGGDRTACWRSVNPTATASGWGRAAGLGRWRSTKSLQRQADRDPRAGAGQGHRATAATETSRWRTWQPLAVVGNWTNRLRAARGSAIAATSRLTGGRTELAKMTRAALSRQRAPGRGFELG